MALQSSSRCAYPCASAGHVWSSSCGVQHFEGGVRSRRIVRCTRCASGGPVDRHTCPWQRRPCGSFRVRLKEYFATRVVGLSFAPSGGALVGDVAQGQVLSHLVTGTDRPRFSLLPDLVSARLGTAQGRVAEYGGLPAGHPAASNFCFPFQSLQITLC